MKPESTDEIVRLAHDVHEYISREDFDQAVALDLIDQLLANATGLAFGILHGGRFLTALCHHCGKPMAETFGVLIHVNPVVPECPDVCFADDPNFSACNNPDCKPINIKDVSHES